MNSLINLFFKKRASVSKSNKIIFEVEEGPDINIKLDFELNSDNAAYYFGIFLDQLTKGDISKSIIDIMADMPKEYPGYVDFIKNSLVVWEIEMRKKESSQLNKPIVLPTQFSYMSKASL